ncbi:hypothetical protein D3C87_2135200 [compost metagenome]
MNYIVNKSLTVNGHCKSFTDFNVRERFFSDIEFVVVNSANTFAGEFVRKFFLYDWNLF